MTIIDRYILSNYRQPSYKLADAIGVSETFVEVRKTILLDTGHPITIKADYRDEISALANLIEERGQGWAVDVARERIRQLESIAKVGNTE